MLEAAARNEKAKKRDAKNAMKTLNAYENAKKNACAATNLQLWSMSPFAADGLSRPGRIDIFCNVPKYAVRFGMLSTSYLQEVSYHYLCLVNLFRVPKTTACRNHDCRNTARNVPSGGCRS